MKISIDAGHGYTTPGKRTVDGMREYEFNRAVANEIKTLLAGYENVTILFTHSDSRDVPLQERTDKANKELADVFVSIHANAFGSGTAWNDVKGIETYVHDSRPQQALALANAVQKELFEKSKRTDRGVKAANFHVLRETKMTAILIECGFMTNQEEAQALKSAAYRKLCAEAITEALAAFYKLKKIAPPAPPPAPGKLYKVQVGAFANKANADALANELRSKGYSVIVIAE
ncbi:N-acetylmuramoyl-L-alanine amidase [Metabacillus indicus]|uniref:N-acetylmuramoyl-L-alanine amidase n=1 Tax=Metabacillus indicus TaxID=246786 RepID=UPI002A005FEF|nr:N-acetylmuramoyl-L-alanine amidase [Metabacillus indicus]MDX8288908.1 N-acetylmuramoyl-L-alanine amidase [Metabacillus indicus]